MKQAFIYLSHKMNNSNIVSLYCFFYQNLKRYFKINLYKNLEGDRFKKKICFQAFRRFRVDHDRSATSCESRKRSTCVLFLFLFSYQAERL